ncbi:hypothetical protein [Flavobacterium sp. J27]|uniref:hypothetical protein n=1 Tax=Flavobacterium sp. J27 TaxID=2060419 RepID=UPI00102F6BAB|nr:hypothetical protein [Flavobacterium sp. J27]
MKTKLSEDFQDKMLSFIENRFEDENNKIILRKVDWKTVAENCFNQMIAFFDKMSLQDLKDNTINQIGAITFSWNEYDGDITIDFAPNNDEETAFDEGYIMAESAIDNDLFFQKYFNCSGAESFETIGEDYTSLIYCFEMILEAIITEVSQNKSFNRLPLKSPCLFGFTAFDDELPSVFFTYN